MLSILIPVYNFDVRALVKDLHEQALLTTCEFEIICIDDASEDRFKRLNRELEGLSFFSLTELNTNVGRSAIRNLLAEKAQFPYLLFMDCDSQTESKAYISNYLKHVNPNEVIYGGRTYSPEPPKESELYFRWYYGINREMIPTLKRQIHPYRCFLTNNFLLPKSIFNSIKMDTDLIGYGHEDTLFSMELKAKSIRIKHIDNPLRHIGLENTDTFIAQTKNGLRNLNWLIRKGKLDRENKLFNASRFFKLKLLRKWLLRWLNQNEQKIEANLKSKSPSLRTFDWYKLACLIRIQDENSN